jgi:hypothetical protein
MKNEAHEAIRRQGEQKKGARTKSKQEVTATPIKCCIDDNQKWGK